jgi:hypothetical protein
MGDDESSTMAKESLNDILNDEPQTDAPETEATVETPAEPETEQVEEISASKSARDRLREDETSDGPVRDEKGRFASKGEPETPAVEAPPASEGEQGTIPVAALKDERSKRQALEAELQQMRAYVQQMQQPVQQQPTTQPDRWEDPEGYDRWLVQQVTAAAEQKATEAFHYQRIATAAVQFKADKPDYDDTIQVFGQMASANPGLIQQMQQSVNPAQFAYDTAKQAIAIQSAGSLDAYIQQEADRRAAAKAAEQTQALASVADKLPSAPPTITNDRSVAGRNPPQYIGPTSLNDILS